MTEQQAKELDKRFLSIEAWGEILTSELADLFNVVKDQQSEIEALKTKLADIEKQVKQSPYNRKTEFTIEIDKTNE